jgi:hypothetical protein
MTALQHQRLLAQTKVFRVSNWLSSETVWTPQPTERHAEMLGNLLALPGVHDNFVPDTHLAALAIEHDLTLCSTDGDLTPAFREIQAPPSLWAGLAKNRAGFHDHHTSGRSRGRECLVAQGRG